MRKFIFLMVIFALCLSACDNKNPPIKIEIGDKMEFGGIEWLVLHVEDGKALILSEKILKKRAYHDKEEYVTWENCDIREYLNNSFYNSEFSENEKNRIIEVSNGDEIVDKVFLLSVDEVNEYMNNDAHEKIKNEKITENIDTGEISAWLLRSDDLSDVGWYVGINGNVSGFGNVVIHRHGGVRPAMWITIEE